MAKWLVSCGVTTAAMESTGVYWIPAYDVLEQHGVKPCLGDAHGMKNVPGRRTDWHECQWIQFLHSVGLLRAAFRPDGEVCAVRSLMRHRNDLVQMTNQHIQHIHKALTQMNVQIHTLIFRRRGPAPCRGNQVRPLSERWRRIQPARVTTRARVYN